MIKLTRSALTMLLAHYRSIFKHAYVKGLATAVVVGPLGLTGTAHATGGTWDDVLGASNDVTENKLVYEAGNASASKNDAPVISDGKSLTVRGVAVGDVDTINSETGKFGTLVIDASKSGKEGTGDANAASVTTTGAIGATQAINVTLTGTSGDSAVEAKLAGGAATTLNTVTMTGKSTIESTGALIITGEVSGEADSTISGGADVTFQDNVSGVGTVNATGAVTLTAGKSIDVGTLKLDSTFADTDALEKTTVKATTFTIGANTSFTVTNAGGELELVNKGDTEATIAKSAALLGTAGGKIILSGDGGWGITGGGADTANLVLNAETTISDAGITGLAGFTLNNGKTLNLQQSVATAAGGDIAIKGDLVVSGTAAALVATAAGSPNATGALTFSGAELSFANDDDKLALTNGSTTATDLGGLTIDAESKKGTLDLTAGDFQIGSDGFDGLDLVTLTQTDGTLTVSGVAEKLVSFEQTTGTVEFDGGTLKADNLTFGGGVALDDDATGTISLTDAANGAISLADLTLGDGAKLTIVNGDEIAENQVDLSALTPTGTVANEGTVILTGNFSATAASDLTSLADGTNGGSVAYLNAKIYTDVTESAVATALNALTADQQALTSASTSGSVIINEGKLATEYNGEYDDKAEDGVLTIDSDFFKDIAGDLTHAISDVKWLTVNQLAYQEGGLDDELTSFNTGVDEVLLETDLSVTPADTADEFTAKSFVVGRGGDLTLDGTKAAVSGEATELSVATSGEATLIKNVLLKSLTNAGGDLTLDSAIVTAGEISLLSGDTVVVSDSSLEGKVNLDVGTLDVGNGINLTVTGENGSVLTGEVDSTQQSGTVILAGVNTLGGNVDLGEAVSLSGVALNGAGYTLTADTVTVDNGGLDVTGDLTLDGSTNQLAVNGKITSSNNSDLTLKANSTNATALTATNSVTGVKNLTLDGSNGVYTVDGAAITVTGDLTGTSGVATATLGNTTKAEITANGAVDLSKVGTLTIGTNGAEITAGSTLQIGSERVITNALTLSNGTGTTNLSKATGAGALNLDTSGNGVYSLGTIGTGGLTGKVTIAEGVTATAKVVDDNASNLVDNDGVLDLTSASSIVLTTPGTVTSTNSTGVVLLNASKVLDATATSAGDWDWKDGITTGAITTDNKLNISGLSAKTVDVDDFATLKTTLVTNAGTLILSDVQWAGEAEDGTITLDELNTIGNVAPSANVVGDAAAGDETETLGTNMEIGTFTTAADAVSTGGNTITLDGDGEGGAFITGNKEVELGSGTLAVNNSGTLGAITGFSTPASANDEAAIIAARTQAGDGTLNLNTGSDGVPLSKISSSSVITVEKIGDYDDTTDADTVTYNRVANVNLGKGVANVTGSMYADTVTINNGAVMTAAAADLTGDITTNASNGSATYGVAGELALAGGEDQLIEGTDVTANALNVIDTGESRTIIVSDVDGKASVVDVETLSLNGNKLFVDPSIVKVGTVVNTSTSEATALDGAVIVGNTSGFYVGATDENLDSFIYKSATDDTVNLVTSNKVNNQSVAYDAVGYIDGGLVVGYNTDTNEDEVLENDGASGILINPTLNNAVLNNGTPWNASNPNTTPNTGEWVSVIDGVNTATTTAKTVKADDNFVANSIKVVNNGLLVVSGDVSFAATDMADNLALETSIDISGEGVAKYTWNDAHDGIYVSDNSDPGQLLLTGDSATMTAEQVILDGGTVYVDADSATLRGTGGLDANGVAQNAGIAADDVSFVIARGSTLTLDNDGSYYDTTTEEYKNVASLSSNDNDDAQINGTLVLDGYFETKNDRFENYPVTAAGFTDKSTLTILEDSAYFITDDTDNGVASSVFGFKYINNAGLLELDGADDNDIARITGLNMTNTGTLNLLGFTQFGQPSENTRTITNSGTINVTGLRNFLETDDDGNAKAGKFVQTGEGVINVGVASPETDAELTIEAEVFSFEGAVNVQTAGSTLFVNNNAALEHADLTGVTFTNVGTVDLNADFAGLNTQGFKLSSSQLDSTATAATSNSLIWHNTGYTSRGTLNIGGTTIYVDNANLSEATSTGGVDLITGDGEIRVSGTTTLDDLYALDSDLYTGSLSANELVINDTAVVVKKALKATSVTTANGADLDLGADGASFDGGKAELYAVTNGNIHILGDSSTIGKLTAGSSTDSVYGVTAGTIDVDGSITANGVEVLSNGSVVTFGEDEESTINGEVKTVTGGTVVIEEGHDVTAVKGLNVVANSLIVNDDSSLTLSWKDIAGSASTAIPEDEKAADLKKAFKELGTTYEQGAVQTLSAFSEVEIQDYSNSAAITAQQYSNLYDIVMSSNAANSVGNLVVTGATYDVAGVEGYNSETNSIAQEDIPATVAQGEFFKGVHVTGVSATALSGAITWGSAALATGKALNIGTDGKEAAVQFTNPVELTVTAEDESTSKVKAWVVTADGAVGDVNLGKVNSAKDVGLKLEGSGELGTVTFNQTSDAGGESILALEGNESAQATVTIGKLVNGTAAEQAGTLEAAYADITVTAGAVSLDKLELGNGSITTKVGAISANDGELVNAKVTAAKGVTLADQDSVQSSTVTAQDGVVSVTAAGKVTDSAFTGTTTVAVEGANNVTGNTLTAGTNATLTASGVGRNVTGNTVVAGASEVDSTAKLTVANGLQRDDLTGEYITAEVSGNTVKVEKVNGERADSKAEFSVGDGVQDDNNGNVLGRHDIKNNVVEAETVVYNAGNYNAVTNDKVTADKHFEVTLGDETTVANSTFVALGTLEDKDSTIAGELTSNNRVEVLNGELKLTGDLDVLGGSTVDTHVLNLDGKDLFIDPAYVYADQVTSNTSTINDTLNGNVTVGEGSGLYIGAEDEANNNLNGVGALRGYVEGSNYNAVAYIESPVTIASGKQLIVDNRLTAANVDDTLADVDYEGYGDAVYVYAGDALVLTNDALGEQDADGNYTDGGINVSGGTVDIDGTLDIKDINTFVGQKINAFNKVNATNGIAVNDIVAGNKLFSGTAAREGGDGVVTVAYSEANANVALAMTDDSIADPIKAYAQNSNKDNQFLASSFVNKALGSERTVNETGKALNSAARFAVLGGAVQNAQVAQRAYTDAIEERMGFSAKTSSNIGEVKGTDITVWVTPQYSYSDSDGYSAGKSGGYGMDSKLWGIALGADVAFQNGLTAGMAFHGGSGKSDKNGGGFAKTHSDFTYFGLSLYGAYQYQGFKVLGDFTFTNTRNDIDQDNPVGKIKDKFDTNLYSIGLTGKYDFTFDGGVTVTPHLGVRWSHFKVDSFTASVDGADSIKGKSFNGDQVTFPVGVGVSKDFRTKNGWALKPAADFSVIPVAGDRDVKSKIVSNDIEMSAKSDISDAVMFRGRVGFDAQYKNFGLGIGYTYLGSKNTSSHSFSVTARYTF